MREEMKEDGSPSRQHAHGNTQREITTETAWIIDRTTHTLLASFLFLLFRAFSSFFLYNRPESFFLLAQFNTAFSSSLYTCKQQQNFQRQGGQRFASLPPSPTKIKNVCAVCEPSSSPTFLSSRVETSRGPGLRQRTRRLRVAGRHAAPPPRAQFPRARPQSALPGLPPEHVTQGKADCRPGGFYRCGVGEYLFLLQISCLRLAWLIAFVVVVADSYTCPVLLEVRIYI